MILVDANHPLAGKQLQVWVAIREVREATDEERVVGEAGGPNQAVLDTSEPHYLS